MAGLDWTFYNEMIRTECMDWNGVGLRRGAFEDLEVVKMGKTVLSGVEIELDEDGFIQEPEKWTKGLAEDLAKGENAYPMTEDHWKVINYLRDYYAKFGIAPPIRMLVKQTGIDLKKVYQLFPSGPAKGACKVAGLPKPTGCV